MQDYPLINTAFLYNISNGKITTAFFRDDVKFGFDLTEEITVEGKRLQTSLGANTTSQILIEKVKGNDKLIYKIIQEENNSYNGNSPVFLSAEKFYIPLKNRQTNSYYIAEFSGELRNPQPITKFYNDVGDKSYTDQGGDSYKRTLLSPKTITSVNVNGVDKPTSDYSLNGDIITVLGIKKGDIIIIEYISTTGQPKSISLDSSTAGEDVFIKGVSDADELGTLSRTIVGVGDDSFEGTQSNVFGFNLYRSTANVDYDKIAESTQSIT
ncbi:hypothetical protein AB0R99_00050 [Erwinia amylovora]|uniref:hypothetical protein n=1 Tax=Erwinia amylovora TaxID=552 RepID=UPI0037DD7BE4